MAQSQQTLRSIGSTIADLSKCLAKQLQASNHPEPSFASNAPASLPITPEVQGTRMQLLESLMRLLHLVTGPSQFWMLHTSMNHELLTIDVLNHFNFWDAVPLNGSASYADIARSTNLPEQIVRRFLRMALTMFIFAEEAPGSDRIVHTAASAHLVHAPLFRSYIGHNMQDVRPAATVGVDALTTWIVGRETPPEDVTSCAFPLATDNGHQRGTDLWNFLENFERPDQPKGYRAKQFAGAMQTIGEVTGIGIESVLEEFDWEGLGEATVVDLGGSAGHISAILARKHPKLNIVVQDLAHAESAFNAKIGFTDLSSRIHFQVHDFFQKQILPADVFLIKMIFHDWSDKYVIQIIQNLLGVLKPGNHVIIFDIIVPPDEAMPLPAKKLIAVSDIQMHVLFNSKERKLEDWSEVIKRADARFQLKNVHILPSTPFGIMDFVFE